MNTYYIAEKVEHGKWRPMGFGAHTNRRDAISCAAFPFNVHTRVARYCEDGTIQVIYERGKDGKRIV